jgi:hypothetical protein
MDVLILVTSPKDTASWSDAQRRRRWAGVMDWHDYALALNERGKLPWAWGLRNLLDTTKPTAVDHGLAAIYQVDNLAELTSMLDEDPLREVSEYLSVPLATLAEDFANDTERFESAKKGLIGDDPVAMLKYTEYEAAMAKVPRHVGNFTSRLPANAPVDFDRLSEPGDALEILVNGTNPDGYTDWDDLRLLLHYQKVLWWHHYTWMLVEQGIKSHSWGVHDFCTTIYNSNKRAAAMDVFNVPNLETFTKYFALDPIRDDSLYQVALLRPIAEQRRSDHRRAARVLGGTPVALTRSLVPAATGR